MFRLKRLPCGCRIFEFLRSLVLLWHALKRANQWTVVILPNKIACVLLVVILVFHLLVGILLKWGPHQRDILSLDDANNIIQRLAYYAYAKAMLPGGGQTLIGHI